MKKTLALIVSSVAGLCLLASLEVMAADIVNYPVFQISVTGIEAKVTGRYKKEMEDVLKKVDAYGGQDGGQVSNQ